MKDPSAAAAEGSFSFDPHVILSAAKDPSGEEIPALFYRFSSWI